MAKNQISQPRDDDPKGENPNASFRPDKDRPENDARPGQYPAAKDLKLTAVGNLKKQTK